MYFIGNEKEISVFFSLTAERIIVGRSVEKRIEIEKSSFGNGWRFFMLKKVMADKLWREVRQTGSDGAAEGERR